MPGYPISFLRSRYDRILRPSIKSKMNPLMTQLEAECWHTGHTAKTLRRNIIVELVDSIGLLLVE